MHVPRVFVSYLYQVAVLPLALGALILLEEASGYDSALASYPELRPQYDPAVEEILGKLERAAPEGGAFSGAVRWKIESARKLDLDRQNFGPFSLKSVPNWHFPPEDPGFWREGAYSIAALGADFRMEKPEDAVSPADWWEKHGEALYARAWSEDWPTIWRFHHDALEAGMLGYPEGLCLLLCAFNPGEYLRRAERLERGEKRRWNGGAYETLLATPSWVAKPLFLENRTHFPFNESTLISWASLRPAITYLVDVDRGLVVGAEFVYYRVLRDSPKDWHAGAKPSGLVITSFAEEVARSPQGAWYPVRIVSEIREGEAVARRTELSVELGDPPTKSPLGPLPEGKRKIDPWPKYRSEVYRKWLEAGDLDHANRLGYAASLAYEGADLEGAEAAIAEAIAALERDPMLEPESFGGIDWELGFALYELLWRWPKEDLPKIWDRFPPTSTWQAVLARAVNLYQEYRPDEAERTGRILEGWEAAFESRRRETVERELFEDYRATIAERAARRRAEGDLESAAHFERVLSALDAARVR